MKLILLNKHPLFPGAVERTEQKRVAAKQQSKKGAARAMKKRPDNRPFHCETGRWLLVGNLGSRGRGRLGRRGSVAAAELIQDTAATAARSVFLLLLARGQALE